MKKIQLAALMAGVMLATGCTIYHPQAVDIPLINHAGDTRIDASLGLSAIVFPDVLTFNATASYGFSEWFAGQVHLNFGGENFYGQVAPGAYLPLGDHGLLEGYVGVGMGGAWRNKGKVVSDDSLSGYYSYSGRFSVPFGQVNIGWHDLTAAHIDLAFGLKAGAYMPSFKYLRHDMEGVVLPEYTTIYTTPNMLLEPQLMFRIGGESVKFCMRGSFSWLSDMMSDDGGGENFIADMFTLSAGVNFSF